MDIKKILFPTDFSEGSAYAVPYALDLAGKYGAKLYVIHVVYDIVSTTGWYVPHVNVEEMYRSMEENAIKELKKYCEEDLKGYSPVEATTLRGVPHEEILKFASENQTGLIVMGTHSRKGLDRIIFGSTAERVVRYSKCPVLTVGHPA